jgi:phage gp36-like protein
MSVAGIQYAGIDDFIASGLPLGALESINKSVWNRMLIKASSVASGYIGCKYSLPLSRPYDPALVDAVCQIAAWRLACLRGFKPGQGDGNDSVIRQGFLDARQWLVDIANGKVALTVIQAVPPSLQPDVVTSTPRGYGDLTGSGSPSPYVPGPNNWGT